MAKITNRDLLDAVGEAKDEYILESSNVCAYRENRTLSKEDGTERLKINNKGKKPWKKWATAAACIALALIVVSGVISIGSGFGKTSDNAEYSYERNDVAKKESSLVDGDYYYAYDAPESAEYEDYSKKSDEFYGDSNTSSNTYSNKENVKLIYTASVNAQTKEFDKALNWIKSTVDELGGYIESQNTYNGGYYDSGYLRYCTIVVRVPAEAYRGLLEGLSNDSMIVTRVSEDVEDVGLSYYETEQRLETLYTKEERLQELLKEAKNLSDIITLESELSNTEYQIDAYKSQLNRYDSLINFSTISISLNEVYSSTGGIATDNSFGARLARAFKQSFENFSEGVQDFILWISYNFVGIIIFAAIVLLLIKFRPFTKLIRKWKSK